MKNNNRGFTLAELLVVVAIIAVLVAIAIPIFNSQLEKAREATDIANIRDIYAEVAVGMLDGTLVDSGNKMKVMNSLDAEVTTAGENAVITVSSFPINQKVNEWQSATNIKVAGVDVANPGVAATKNLVFTFATETNSNGSKNTYLASITFS